MVPSTMEHDLTKEQMAIIGVLMKEMESNKGTVFPQLFTIPHPQILASYSSISVGFRFVTFSKICEELKYKYQYLSLLYF